MENLKREVIAKHLLRTRPRVGGCVEWIGSIKPNGYGSASAGGKSWNVHRLFYTVFVSPIPEGLQVLHVCDNPCCVSPAHLRLGTHLENMQDMAAKGRANRTGALAANKAIAAKRRAQTHCLVGHLLSGSNLYIKPGSGTRACKTCKRLRKIKSFKKLLTI